MLRRAGADLPRSGLRKEYPRHSASQRSDLTVGSAPHRHGQADGGEHKKPLTQDRRNRIWDERRKNDHKTSSGRGTLA